MTDEAAARALLAFLQKPGAGLHALPRAWLAERSGEALARGDVRPGLNVIGHFRLPVRPAHLGREPRPGPRPPGRRPEPAQRPDDAGYGRTASRPLPGDGDHDTTLIQPAAGALLPARLPAGRPPAAPGADLRIGYWYWEFDAVRRPGTRRPCSATSFWTATEFVAAGLRRQYRQPVHVLPPGVEIAPFTPLPRAAFGLRDDEFRVRLRVPHDERPWTGRTRSA